MVALRSSLAETPSSHPPLQTSQLLRLPRIVCMILLGIALYPSVHVSVINTATFVSNPLGGAAIDVSGHETAGPNSAPFAAQNPASTIRSTALLVALARGGLSVRMAYFRELGLAMLAIAVLPYAFELIAEGLVAPSILPASAGFSGAGSTVSWVLPFAAATVWAPLSPSIVVPNMLAFVDQGLTAAGSLVLTGAPLEVSTALITEGVFNNVVLSSKTGLSNAEVSQRAPTGSHCPSHIIEDRADSIAHPASRLDVRSWATSPCTSSEARCEWERVCVRSLGLSLPNPPCRSHSYGIAFALAYWAYAWLRPHALVGRSRSYFSLALSHPLTLAPPPHPPRPTQVTRVFGKMDPVEPKLIWICAFILCYTTSVDDTNTPHLIGFFAALCCAIATQVPPGLSLALGGSAASCVHDHCIAAPCPATVPPP